MVELKIRGTLKLKVDGRIIELHNNIASDYIYLLQALLTTGSATPYAGGNFQPITGVSFVFLSNGSVVYVLPANVNSYTDSGTSVSVIYRSTSTSSFTFDTIELWSVLNGSLYYRIAYYNFESSISVNNFIDITWTITATSKETYDVNYLFYSVLGFRNRYPQLQQSLPSFSVVLYVTALTLVPLYVLTSYTNSNWYSFYTYVGQSTQLNGVGQMLINPGTANPTTVQPYDECYTLTLSQGVYLVLVYYVIGGIQVPYFSQSLQIVPQPGLSTPISHFCVSVNVVTQ